MTRHQLKRDPDLCYPRQRRSFRFPSADTRWLLVPSSVSGIRRASLDPEHHNHHLSVVEAHAGQTVRICCHQIDIIVAPQQVSFLVRCSLYPVSTRREGNYLWSSLVVTNTETELRSIVVVGWRTICSALASNFRHRKMGEDADGRRYKDEHPVVHPRMESS